jgi:transglutaminase-like putative cysteine protease
LCRSLEIPARYVSGYLVMDSNTPPREGGPSRGAGASHAWVEAWTPTHGWRGFDPTNNVLASENHVKMAIGRDYADVPPSRGVYRGSAPETLTVEVTTKILD